MISLVTPCRLERALAEIEGVVDLATELRCGVEQLLFLAEK